MVATLKPRLATLDARVARTPVVQRTRGSTWMRIRRAQLCAHPLCAACRSRGVVAAAEEVDHVVPLHLGGTDDAVNLQSLCVECHRAKTASEAASRARGG